MGRTSIEWTEETWNPVRGCSRVSPGCDNCYAKDIAYRFSGPGLHSEGLATLRNGKTDWTGIVRPVQDKLTEPLHWRRARRVFVNSQSDLFHRGFRDDQIDDVIGIIAACHALGYGHTFQLLTKRADRLPEYFGTDRRGAWARAAQHLEDGDRAYDAIAYGPRVLPNLWLGVSVESPAYKSRLHHLLSVDAAVHFASFEPLLEDLGDIRLFLHDSTCMHVGAGHEKLPCTCSEPRERHLEWGIVGGESGAGARSYPLAGARAIIEQFQEAGIPIFHKQVGRTVTMDEDAIHETWGPFVRFHEDLDLLRPAHRKGGDPAEWPRSLRVRQYPKTLQRVNRS